MSQNLITKGRKVELGLGNATSVRDRLQIYNQSKANAFGNSPGEDELVGNDRLFQNKYSDAQTK